MDITIQITYTAYCTECGNIIKNSYFGHKYDKQMENVIDALNKEGWKEVEGETLCRNCVNRLEGK